MNEIFIAKTAFEGSLQDPNDFDVLVPKLSHTKPPSLSLVIIGEQEHISLMWLGSLKKLKMCFSLSRPNLPFILLHSFSPWFP